MRVVGRPHEGGVIGGTRGTWERRAKRVLDIVLHNLTIIDGTGAPSRPGDVVISGDRIRAVTAPSPPPPLSPAAPSPEFPADHPRGGTGRLELDCSGLYAAPGFIDIHSHSDLSIFLEGSATNYVAQGVTFLVNGNCGFSGAPVDLARPEAAVLVGDDPRLRRVVTWRGFGEYMEALEKSPKAVNFATYVGHGNVRVGVLGAADRAPGPGDLEKMKAMVREAMEAGAFGLSTGLIYAPGLFASTEEVVELAKTAASYGGLYATHVRGESDSLVDAVLEAIRVGREAGCRVQIAHHKAAGRRNWGLVRTTLDLMEYYRRFGVEVTCDVYPCTAGATSLAALLPFWTQSGGKAETLARLRDPAVRERVKRELGRPDPRSPNLFFDAGPAGVRVAESRVLPHYLGLSLAEIARETGKDPVETMLDLLAEDFDLGVTVAGMAEEDVCYVLGHRLSMVSSDAAVVVPGEGLPHPRTYRAFTRALATYARDEKVLGLEQAVHKMTGLPAWKLGLSDRGLLRPGAKADVVVFDLWRLGTAADYGDPHHPAEGMVHVLVNGEFVIRDEKPTGARPGELVRRPGPC